MTLSTTAGSLSSVTDNNDGTYTATLTSTTVGSATITGTIADNAITSNANVQFVPGAPTQITMGGSTADLASGASRTLTGWIEDANGHTITSDNSTQITFAQTSGAGSVTGTGTVTVNAGIATIDVTGDHSGFVVITASSTGLTSDSLSFTVTAGGASGATSSISANPTGIPATGTSTSAITVTVNDSNGNRTSGGSTVALSTTAGSLSAVTDNHDGTYSATLTSSTTVGTATISGTVDGAAIGSNATVDFTTPDTPSAGNDAYSMSQGVTLNVPAPGVLVNDSDPNNLPLTAVLNTSPSHGTLSLNSDGSFTYTPEASFTGTDTFTYRASNGTVQSNPATVTITVSAVNHPPVCRNTALTTNENTPADVAPLCSDPDGNALTFSIVTQGSKGTASIANGQLHYVPAQNATGADSFTYAASDGSLTSNAASVAVTINGSPAPVTTIDSHPTNPSASATAQFTFHADIANSTFECQLDGTGFTPCSSPKSYEGLTDGSRTFQVRATSPNGKIGAPASYTWIVDTTPPTPVETFIDQFPPDPSGADVSFAFSSNKSNATFECSLDGESFGACSTPKSYTNLADGHHTFRVRASDALGNTDPTPAEYSWTVSTGPQPPPDTLIDSAPPSLSAASVVFTFSSDKTGATFECKLDDGPFQPCSTPTTYGDLSDGSHTFQVRASKDGQTDPTPASYTWTVNAPPRLVSSDPADGSSRTTPLTSWSLTASEDVRWTNVTATRSSDGDVKTLADGPGVTIERAYQSSVPALYTIKATISDGINAPVVVMSNTTIQSDNANTPQPVQVVAQPNEPGHLETSDGALRMSWPAEAVANLPSSDSLVIKIDPQATTTPPGDGWDAASYIFDITARLVNAGTPVRSFPAPLHFAMPITDPDLVPFVREEAGQGWRALDKIQTPNLPEGSRDGYYIENKPCEDGPPDTLCLHILTLHLTEYMLAKPKPGTKLNFKINTAKRLELTKKSFAVRVFVNLKVTTAFTLRTKRGTPVAAWKLRTPSGVSFPMLKLDPPLKKPGTYTLTAVAAGFSQQRVRRVTIRFERKIPPIVKLGPKVGVMLLTGTNNPPFDLPSKYEVFSVPSADDTWDYASKPAQNVSIAVVNVDLYGVEFLLNLHKVYPNMKFIALTRSPATFALLDKVKPKGTVVPLMMPAQAKLVELWIKKLATVGANKKPKKPKANAKKPVAARSKMHAPVRQRG